jgi:hypothetical protein
MPEALDANDLDDKLLDKYLNAELIFNVGTGNECKGRVVKRAKGTSSEPIDCAHSSPLLFDTPEYVVEFTDGSTLQMSLQSESKFVKMKSPIRYEENCFSITIFFVFLN